MSLVQMLFVAVALAAACLAQPVQVSSEFRRLGPTAAPIAADAKEPRVEILSPEVVRNGFASFHVAVKVPPGARYELHVAQNPDDVVQPYLYRDKLGALDPAILPVLTTFRPDSGQTVDLYWLDLWVPAEAPAERIRVEVQLNVGNQWTIYPMEVRISERTVPGDVAAMLTRSDKAVPGPGLSANDIAYGALRAALCDKIQAPGSDARSVRQMLQRNAIQDAALYRQGETAAACPAEAALEPGGYFRLRRKIWSASK